jgi:hypothetical protein
VVDKVNVDEDPASTDLCARDFPRASFFLKRDRMDLKKGSGGP